MSRFEGTERYVATDDLMMAVNAAIVLGRPLLVKGEPGTEKTQLASEIAHGLNHPLIEWHIKSITKAQQGLYEYDAVASPPPQQVLDLTRVSTMPAKCDPINHIAPGKTTID